MSTYNSTSPDYFFTDIDEIRRRITSIDPRAYDRTRNYLDGAVTHLSPFITHGVISTTDVAQGVLSSHSNKHCYRLLYELAWREYFHRTWQLHGDKIFNDLLHSQEQVYGVKMPAAIANASTGINVLDEAVINLQQHGIMHNHARMWLAGVVCNIAHRAWLPAARWMHYHLLDGDLASNSLSWQWIAGTFSHKRYIANQGNLNRYSKTPQHGGFLDVSYEELAVMDTPEVLLESIDPLLDSSPPRKKIVPLQGKVALHSLWNLDPTWQNTIDHHVLFVEEQWIKQWPLSKLRWDFIQHLAVQCQCELMIGSINDLTKASENASLIHREYPATRHWPGTLEGREWLYPLPEKPYTSFSQYWKQVRHTVSL